MFGKLIRGITIILIVVSMIIGSMGEALAYDFGAEHPYINAKVDVEATKAKLWNSIRSWGFSEAATAGIMGNLFQESSYQYTIVQGRFNLKMSEFTSGNYGLGLAQWTYPSRQQELFDVCDMFGVQWTDLDAQLYLLKKELMTYGNWWTYGGNFETIEEFMNTDNVQLATDVVLWGFEAPNPAHARIEVRRGEAQKVYSQFTGTEIDMTETNSGNYGYNINANVIVDEWELKGMPGYSSYLKDCERVILPNYNQLNATERGSLSVIKENILSEKSFSLYDTLRVFVVFLGLIAVIYSVLFAIAYLFDRTNNIFEISLVTIVTFGLLRFTDDEEYDNAKGYVGKTKVVKVSLLCMVVGLFIVSGGVFSVISRLIIRVISAV